MSLKIPENLTQIAFKHIRDEIICGRLDGRQHLTENYFAERYRISKSPVREALNRLEAEGLITIVPRRGAFVVEFSIEDVEEIFDLREALETLAVRRAVVDAIVLGGLRTALDSAKKYREANDKANYVRADAAFHTILLEAGTNSRLKKMLGNILNQTLIVRYRTFELSSHTSLAQHLDILRALERGKRKVAADLMAEHIRTVRARLIDHLRNREVSPHSSET